MKSFSSRALVMALTSCIILVCAFQAAAQTRVLVVNPQKEPVWTRAHGTTNVSGSVEVTNNATNPLPVSGSVSITNNSVPVNVTNSPLGVSGTVAVSNLPLDPKGNVLVDVAPDTTQYQYQLVVSAGCNDQDGIPGDFCTQDGNLVEVSLNTYSSQGYEVFAASPIANPTQGNAFLMVYTLRAPATGAHKKAAPVHR